MPIIGELVPARSIGIKTRCYYKWQACPNCGKERWVRNNKPIDYLCIKCGRVKAAETRSQAVRPANLEFKHACDLGKRGRYYSFKDSCPACGKHIWRQKVNLGAYCRKCKGQIFQAEQMRGENNPRWVGGRYADKLGYIHICIAPDNSYYSMATKWSHTVLEHRLVMAQHLGRCLKSWEVVHHKNKIKGDNRLENLELLPDASIHTPFTKMEQRIGNLEKRVLLLEMENELLRKQLEDAKV